MYISPHIWRATSFLKSCFIYHRKTDREMSGKYILLDLFRWQNIYEDKLKKILTIKENSLWSHSNGKLITETPLKLAAMDRATLFLRQKHSCAFTRCHDMIRCIATIPYRLCFKWAIISSLGSTIRSFLGNCNFTIISPMNVRSWKVSM